MTTSVVDPSRRKRRMSAGVGCLVLLGLTLAALAHVAVQARHNEVALALGVEQRQNHELLEQRRRLKADIERLKAPARIERMARDDLKMALPAPGDIRSLPR